MGVAIQPRWRLPVRVMDSRQYLMSFLANFISGRVEFGALSVVHATASLYRYRLCPASDPLTEDCFAAHPMDFVRGSQALEWKDGR